MLLFARGKGVELLVDKKALLAIARMFGLKTWSTWAVLIGSLSMGYIEVSNYPSSH